MTEEFTRQSEQLEILKGLASKRGEDRLELVSTTVFALNAIDRSIRDGKGNRALTPSDLPPIFSGLEKGLSCGVFEI